MTFITKLEKLILGIKLLISKNRSSLSIDQTVLLEDTITTLEELKSVKNSSIRKKLFSDVLLKLALTYSKMQVAKRIYKFLEEVFNEN